MTTAQQPLAVVYLCPRCLTGYGEPGTCPICRLALLGCRPGSPDDPCRRPLMTGDGQVRARAPVWWLTHSVRRLIELAGPVRPEAP
ncbi:MAG: hypothetical protein HY784_07760 [Chloroflexi bacterium]|nr:hypothetical protein [Chloroflexota bacterium]